MMYQMGVYCRLSKDDGENKVSESIENQMKLIREYVTKSEDLEIADTVAESAVTATADATDVITFSQPEGPEESTVYVEPVDGIGSGKQWREIL